MKKVFLAIFVLFFSFNANAGRLDSYQNNTTIADGDELIYWETAAGAVKNITFGNMKSSLPSGSNNFAVAIKNGNYTITSSDNGKLLIFRTAGNITIPDLPDNFSCYILNESSSPLSIAPAYQTQVPYLNGIALAAGHKINSPASPGAYAHLYREGDDEVGLIAIRGEWVDGGSGNFEWEDYFDRANNVSLGSNWITIPYNYLKIENQQTHLAYMGGAAIGILSSSPNLKNGDIQLTVCDEDSAWDFPGALFRYVNGNYYVAYIKRIDNLIVLAKYVNGSETILAQTTASLASGTSYPLRINFNDRLVEVILNSNKLITYTIPQAEFDAWPSGNVGIYIFRQGDATGWVDGFNVSGTLAN